MIEVGRILTDAVRRNIRAWGMFDWSGMAETTVIPEQGISAFS
jgi:hypothetical protein